MRRSLAAWVVIAAVCAPLPARATTVIAKDFAALCGEADVVFVGTVQAVESRWVDAEREAIETLVTFVDLTPLRGVAGDVITLRFGGGTVDGLREEIAGAPRFAVGERAVIFARHGVLISPLVGFSQGRLPVLEGPDGPVVATGDPSSAGTRAAQRLGAAGADGAPLALDAFVERVRAALAARPDAAP